MSENKINQASALTEMGGTEAEATQEAMGQTAAAEQSALLAEQAPALPEKTDMTDLAAGEAEADGAAEPAEQAEPQSVKVRPSKLCVAVYLLAGVAGICHLIAVLSQPFADFFNRYISSAFRAVTATVTSVLPWSLAETVVCMAPVVLVIALLRVFLVLSRDDARLHRSLWRMIALAAGLYAMLVFTFVTGYQTTPLDEKLALSRKPVSAVQLRYTAEQLKSEIQQIVAEAEEKGELKYLSGGASVRPYSHKVMVEKLNDAYEALQSEHPTLLPKLRAPVKPIALSEPMTYTHISGVYSYFTGEANVNTNFPDYSLPYTAAHEMGHQRGIAREDEANFVAFLACDASDDLYIRYSGYVNLLEYVMNALYSADAESYFAFLKTLPKQVYGEMVAYNQFFEPYRESTAAEVSSAVNDTYLKVNGQAAGERSYGMVVDLAVCYFAAD